MFRKILKFFPMALLLALWGSAQADIVINGTRVIYAEKDREAVVQLSNRGDVPLLVQSWIDDGDSKSNPANATAPFTLTPPVARIDPNKGQTIRILQTQDSLPKDRESLFWLNVVEIPPVPTTQATIDQSFMQISFRTRIKLFYRPASLPMTTAQAYDKLTFELKPGSSGYEVRVSNPSPYYITFRALDLRQSSASSPVLAQMGNVDNKMIAPYGELFFPLPELKVIAPTGTRVFYTLINDSGGSTNADRVLTH